MKYMIGTNNINDDVNSNNDNNSDNDLAIIV